MNSYNAAFMQVGSLYHASLKVECGQSWTWPQQASQRYANEGVCTDLKWYTWEHVVAMNISDAFHFSWFQFGTLDSTDSGPAALHDVPAQDRIEPLVQFK